MKIKINKLLMMDQNVKLQIILSASALMHVTFLLIFSFTERYMMAVFNIFSVGLYLAGAVDCIRKTSGKHIKFWIIAVFTEIVLHATLCTILMGLESFFFLYLMLTIPIAGYTLFLYLDKKSFNKITGIFTVVTVFAVVLCVVFDKLFGSLCEYLPSIRTMTEAELRLLRIVNIIFAMFTLFGFTFLFCSEINSLIEKLNQSNQKLEYTATHDELTGLSNRHSLWKYFDGLLKSREHYCVVLGDIDDFKKVNDTFGHECGDLVLKAVAEIILGQVRDGDMACRWGGEEMLLIMRGDRSECYSRVDEIKKRICALGITSGGRAVKVSMTFGFADCAELEKQLSENREHNVNNLHICMDNMIALADKKLYIGKNNGKNVIVA